MNKKVNVLMAAILVACLTVFSNSAMAQGFSIGPRIGWNLSTVSGLDVASADTSFGSFPMESSSLSGLVVGAVANIGISEMFSVQPEILFSQQGVKQEAAFFGIPISASTRLNYINLPILAKVSFGPENIKGFVTAGPSFGYLLGGTITASALGQEESMDITDDQLEEMNRMDIGLSLGAGVAIGAGPGNLNIDLRYGLGFTDINNFETKPDNYEAAKNGVFSISVAYLFKLGGE